MNEQHIEPWVSQHLHALGLDYHTIHINGWPGLLTVNIFLHTRAEVEAARASGLVDRLIPHITNGVHQHFAAVVAGRPVETRVDSYQTVLEDYNGNWYHYYK